MTKYACIAIHSTCQCKYWNYPNGWDTIVKYLNDNGYSVKHISKESGEYMGNKPPKDAEDYTNRSIESTCKTLSMSKLFIGVSSGVSWLSWGLSVPTIIISGFTKPFTEPINGIERVFNPNACNGCINDPEIQFNKGDWNWCPRNNNFECSTTITPEMVIEKINKILKLSNERNQS